MKKLLCCVLAAALFASCKKEEKTATPATPTPATIPTDGWTWDGVKHKQIYGTRQANQRLINALDATSNPIYTFGASFKELPTANGTYHIVTYVPDSLLSYPAEKIGPNDVVIICSIPNPANASSNTTYWSKGLEGKDATVTITGGKIKVEVPEITVTSTANDNIKVTGTMVEY